MDFNQRWVIDATWEPKSVDEVKGHIKVKGHLRSSWSWNCESELIWKIEVQLEPNLVYWWYVGPFLCLCSQRSHIKVKCPLRSNYNISWNCESGLIWKIEVWLEPILVYCNVGPFVCLCKGHITRSKIIRGQAVLRVPEKAGPDKWRALQEILFWRGSNIHII